MWIHLLTLELIDGASETTFVPPVAAPSAPAGVRHSRYLRRSKTAPRLPWEIEPEPEVVVAPPRRKRIPLPAQKALESAIGPIPIQTIKEISAPSISVPGLGTAVVQLIEDDDEDWLYLI